MVNDESDTTSLPLDTLITLMDYIHPLDLIAFRKVCLRSSIIFFSPISKTNARLVKLSTMLVTRPTSGLGLSQI